METPYKAAGPGGMHAPPQQHTMVVIMPNPPHEWKTELHESCCADCGTFCYAFCCPVCMVYSQRARLLAFTGEPYSCCARDSIARSPGCFSDGYTPPTRALPPVWPPPPGQEPEIMRDFSCELCLEATCCHPCAVDANRRLMQQKFNVHNSSCDDFTICCSVICCVCNRDRESRDNGFATLLACMLTQQAIELKEEESKRPNFVAAGPAHQSMESPAMQTYGAVMPPQGAAYTQQQQPYQANGYPATQQQYHAPPAYNPQA